MVNVYVNGLPLIGGILMLCILVFVVPLLSRNATDRTATFFRGHSAARATKWLRGGANLGPPSVIKDNSALIGHCGAWSLGRRAPVESLGPWSSVGFRGIICWLAHRSAPAKTARHSLGEFRHERSHHFTSHLPSTCSFSRGVGGGSRPRSARCDLDGVRC